MTKSAHTLTSSNRKQHRMSPLDEFNYQTSVTSNFLTLIVI